MTKQELRELYKARRLSLTQTAIAKLSAEMNVRLQQLPLPKSSYVHIYLPIKKWNEFNTFPYIHWLWEQRSDVKIVVSKTGFHTGDLTHYHLDEDVVLSVNRWGIPEPEDSTRLKSIPVSAIDCVLMPLLVCDHQGNRIGYGKGFYDRFLAECRTDVFKVGLSYFEPLLSEAPIMADPWDIKLDALICPFSTVHFR